MRFIPNVRKKAFILLVVLLVAVSIYGCTVKENSPSMRQQMFFLKLIAARDDYDTARDSWGHVISEDDFDILGECQGGGIGYTCMLEKYDDGTVVLFVYQQPKDDDPNFYELIYAKVLPQEAAEALIPILEEVDDHLVYYKTGNKP